MMQLSDYLFLLADQADFWEGLTIILVGSMIVGCVMGVGYAMGYDRGYSSGFNDGVE